MNNIHELPQSSACYEQASEWIAKFDKGLTNAERTAFEAWYHDSEENRTVFTGMAKLWDQMDALARLAEICPDVMAQSIKVRRYEWAIAASIVLTVALWSWSFFRADPDNASSSVATTAAQSLYETTIGEQSTFALTDGSRIILNTNTRVSVHFTARNRFLFLEHGEVHVSVAHDSSRPLSVIVGGKVVQAVGTEFNVEIAGDHRIELLVSEGVVMIGIADSNGDMKNSQVPLVLTPSSKLVTAGQQIVIDAPGDPLERIDVDAIALEDIAVKLSWREGNLIFRGESLEEAVSEVGRYTEVQFVFLDEESKKVRVAGLFKAGDVDGLLTALRQNFNISYEWVADDKIALRGE